MRQGLEAVGDTVAKRAGGLVVSVKAKGLPAESANIPSAVVGRERKRASSSVWM